MSKIGKLPVAIKEGITVDINDSNITVRGPKGELTFVLPEGIAVRQEDGKLIVSQTGNTEETKALFGLTRAIIANMVKGVDSGFEKKLELSGVGYRAQVAGNELSLSVGFSHPVKIKAEPGISFALDENVITVLGADKKLVGDTAARIRAVRVPDPYKAKGISYKGERIRRKAGKAAKTAAGTK